MTLLGSFTCTSTVEAVASDIPNGHENVSDNGYMCGNATTNAKSNGYGDGFNGHETSNGHENSPNGCNDANGLEKSTCHEKSNVYDDAIGCAKSNRRNSSTQQEQKSTETKTGDNEASMERGRGRGAPVGAGGGDGEGTFLELGDLPDNALANAFFSGFLDSLQVASCLKIVSKRMMAVGSGACKVGRRVWKGGEGGVYSIGEIYSISCTAVVVGRGAEGEMGERGTVAHGEGRRFDGRGKGWNMGDGDNDAGVIRRRCDGRSGGLLRLGERAIWGRA